MIPIFIDYETFWSDTHSLSKMSPITYVLHPETEIQSVAIKLGFTGKTEIIFGEDNIRAYYSTIDWSQAMVIAHNNSEFDAMIHAWRFGIKPKLWGCTLAMARPIFAKDAGGSLKAVMKALGCPFEKGSLEDVNTKGKKLAQFSPEEIEKMRTYNGIDTEGCAWIFGRLLKMTPPMEIELIDMTIRMLVEPEFECDVTLLEQTLRSEQERKKLVLLDIATMTGAYEAGMTEDEAGEAARKMLASGPKFAAFMKDLGYDAPTKRSPSNPNKTTLALAKTDEAFLALQDHEEPLIAAAASARLGVKSTILETRIEKFLEAAKYCGGRLPMPTKYYGADTTGRWSGFIFNPQNLPRIGKNPKPSDALRMCIKAPQGHKVVVADLSGIELRVNMFLWKVPYAMGLFNASPDKADLYRYFAAHDLYDVAEDAVTKDQRQVGKVCLSEETLVYCKHVNNIMWVQIKDVKPEYQLWDGLEWVWAQGVVSNGWKETQQLCGIWLTPNHLVLSGTQWLEAKLVKGEKILRALERGAENLPLRGLFQKQGGGSQILLLSATAGFLSTRLKLTMLNSSKRLGATLVLRKHQVKNAIGRTLKQCLRVSTGLGTLTDYQRQSPAATTPKTATTTITAQGGFQFAVAGEKTGASTLGIYERLKVGIFPTMKQTESTLIKGMNRAISGFVLAVKTLKINERFPYFRRESNNLKRNSHVYDILNCGPRNRFTVLSSRGPIIVHNCHLGLGFGAGATTFQGVARLMGGVDMTPEESKSVVEKYRKAHPEIVQGWKTSHAALTLIAQGVTAVIDPWGLCSTCAEGIKTPLGMIRYPNLHQEEIFDENGAPTGKFEWWYGEGRKRARIYAGKVVENIVQHIARCVIAWMAIEIKRKTGRMPKLTVHDELVYIVPENEAVSHLEKVQTVMRSGVPWWPELVTWSEGDIADTYGDAK